MVYSKDNSLTVFASELLISAVPLTILAYLAGSVSAAILVCRAMHLEDPRTSGSGNPGATNVLRLGGKLPAALTLLGDAMKGFLPVIIAMMITDHAPTIALVALAAFLGHLYPVFFNFEGGKGVATALGAVLAIDLSVGALALLTWLAVSLTFRRSSLAALVSFLLIPVYLLFDNQTVFAATFAIIAAFLFYTHRANIQRLIEGSEPTIGNR
ncbi:MAG: glycerol-3-phosphate 1-O-acyltransferase PlsY [Granulosicoccus sp.]|nr:glycerol-3-phosphate 1-O-acyltransferase PlsY [Granulosicoccus sp.]